MISTVHFLLLLFCFTSTFLFSLCFVHFLYCFFHLFLFCPIPDSVSTSISLCYCNLMDSIGWNTPELPVDLALAYRPTTDQGHWWPTDSPNRHTESTIVSSISSTQYLELPANPTWASRSTADQGCWWSQSQLMKGLESTIVSSIDSILTPLYPTPPIPFYNIMGTVSVTPNWCTFTLYLVVQIPTLLDCSIFDTVSFLLHYGNGSNGFIFFWFQFWWLYFCWNIKWQFLVIDVIDKFCLLL